MTANNQRNGCNISCIDAVGRDKAARVFPGDYGRVGIQCPPGEVMVLTVEQLHELWVAAREMCRDSWELPVLVVDAATDPAVLAGSAA